MLNGSTNEPPPPNGASVSRTHAGSRKVLVLVLLASRGSVKPLFSCSYSTGLNLEHCSHDAGCLRWILCCELSGVWLSEIFDHLLICEGYQRVYVIKAGGFFFSMSEINADSFQKKHYHRYYNIIPIITPFINSSIINSFLFLSVYRSIENFSFHHLTIFTLETI